MAYLLPRKGSHHGWRTGRTTGTAGTVSGLPSAGRAAFRATSDRAERPGRRLEHAGINYSARNERAIKGHLRGVVAMLRRLYWPVDRFHDHYCGTDTWIVATARRLRSASCADGLSLPFACLLGTACGGGGSSTAAPPSAPSHSVTPSAPQATRHMTAAEVTTALAAKGLPLTMTKDFTAADDPNSLLGRPGQYTSKTAFLGRAYPSRQARQPADDCQKWWVS